jgi:hypothetical protein
VVYAASRRNDAKNRLTTGRVYLTVNPLRPKAPAELLRFLRSTKGRTVTSGSALFFCRQLAPAGPSYDRRKRLSKLKFEPKEISAEAGLIRVNSDKSGKFWKISAKFFASCTDIRKCVEISLIKLIRRQLRAKSA